MSANVISGRVVLKETGAGIADLIVVIHDLDPGAQGEEEALAAEPPSIAPTRPPSRGDRLGSRLTDPLGRFEFTFDDGEFQIRNVKERRPDLLLTVLAPEEPGVSPDARILYTSSDLRIDAGRTEQYLVRLPREALRKAGYDVDPVDRLTPDTTLQAVDHVTKRADWRTGVIDEARKLVSGRAGNERDRLRQRERDLHAHVIDQLTGTTAAEAEDARIVRPGAPTAPVMWRTANAAIARVNKAATESAFIVLTTEQAAAFKANGVWREHVPASTVAPYLVTARPASERPVTITRADTVDTALRSASGSAEIALGLQPLATPSPPPPPPGAPEDYLATSSDLPKFVGRVIADMHSPDRPLDNSFTDMTPDKLSESLKTMEIGSGPSDVTAFHDYQNLQIAFDFVWEQIVDQDAIDVATVLSRQLTEAGGDPLAAMTDAGMLNGLASETRLIARVNDDVFGDHEPDWVRHPFGDLGGVVQPPRNPPGVGGGGGGTPTPTPTPTYFPPVRGGWTVLGEDRPPHELLGDLEEILTEPYTFEVFAPGSTNFGLLVTYRQKWEPLTYQAGDLVNTITLAPNESRKVVARQTVKRERSERETEANLRNRSDENKSTMRSDAEVVDRATSKTNFNLNAKGTYNVGFAKGDSSTTIDRSAEASSQETKKSFHEDVLNAAMQLRSEKNWSFETKDSDEFESTDTSEIANLNAELTVTYLFYELERRYRVSEHLHRLTPVVMVAMDVPNPSRKAIDKLLLAHSWIINRVLLDDRYRAPLDYLATRVVGDELGLKELQRNLTEIRAAVASLQKMDRDLNTQVAKLEDALDTAVNARANRTSNANDDGALTNAVEWAFGGGGDTEDVESAQILEDLRREELERASRREKELRMRLDAETAALDGAAQSYAKAYAEHSNRLMEVAGLRAHFKENMLYYMQAIWSYTFADQHFFSLYKIKAPKLTRVANAGSTAEEDTAAATYAVEPVSDPAMTSTLFPDQVMLKVTLDYHIKEQIVVEQDAVTLAEIADLDNPLGFKGNYMIFPLRQSNPLVDKMMMPYLDAELGLRDPDWAAAWSPEDFVAQAKAVVEEHRKQGASQDELGGLVDALTAQYQAIVSSPRRVSDEIIVPSNSLFIEALPGSHALLEDFKMAHRQIDLEKAREEARKLKLESLRLAARVLDSQLEDPDIDRQIVIRGTTSGLVTPADQ